jgi:hypothetical protein
MGRLEPCTRNPLEKIECCAELGRDRLKGSLQVPKTMSHRAAHSEPGGTVQQTSCRVDCSVAADHNFGKSCIPCAAMPPGRLSRGDIVLIEFLADCERDHACDQEQTAKRRQ